MILGSCKSCGSTNLIEHHFIKDAFLCRNCWSIFWYIDNKWTFMGKMENEKARQNLKKMQGKHKKRKTM